MGEGQFVVPEHHQALSHMGIYLAFLAALAVPFRISGSCVRVDFPGQDAIIAVKSEVLRPKT
jgi:hypothetical protein